MENIIETLKTHARHQPRRNIIFYGLSHIIQHAIIDVRYDLFLKKKQ